MAKNDLIAVVGCGYVGLVTAVGLAEQGMRVRAFDVDPARIKACRELRFPMLEPGLEDAACAAGDRLTFHDVREEVWPHPAFTFIAVPTPQGEAGYPNLSMLRQVLDVDRRRSKSRQQRERHRHSQHRAARHRPMGAGRDRAPDRRRGPVVANPEFLQEGRALQDFREPSRILIGSENRQAAERLRDLMAFTSAPVIITDTSTAELAKYGSNAYLAMRISFANEMARLAEREGADPLVMLQAIGLDPRIGPNYLKPGVGYGGSCLPKDVAALVSMGSAATSRWSSCARRRKSTSCSAGGSSGRWPRGSKDSPGGASQSSDLHSSPERTTSGKAPGCRSHGSSWRPVWTSWHGTPPSQPICSPRPTPGCRSYGIRWRRYVERMPPSSAQNGRRSSTSTSRARPTMMKGTLLVDGRYAWDPLRASNAGLDLVRIATSRPVRSNAAST